MTAPTDDLRRPRDLTQIIDTALRLYRRNFGEFVAIAAVTLPIDVISAGVSFAIANTVVATVVMVLLDIPSFAIAIVAGAAVARSIADTGEGLAPDFYRAYREVLPRLRDLLLATVRVFGIVLLLSVTIIGIPFAAYFAIRWAFFSQAIVIDGRSAKEAPEASARIVEGFWWRTFGILLVIGLLAAIPTFLVSAVFAPAAPVAGNLASAVVAVVVLPFSAAAATLLFFDLSSRERERVSTT